MVPARSGKFAEFRRRYVAELKAEGEGLDELRATVKGRTVTLLTATKEIDLSHATVLRELAWMRHPGSSGCAFAAHGRVQQRSWRIQHA